MSQYDIGTPGQKWGKQEKELWLAKQIVKRSYQQEVIQKLEALSNDCIVEQYGELNYSLGQYPLFAVKTKNWNANKPVALITGGVHGYETSGVQGAIRFIETEMVRFSQWFNIVVLPCLSPWGYETINRWNPLTIDPNRSFYPNSPAQESALAMGYIKQLAQNVLIHIDLHETTDTDNSQFRPALAAREGTVQTNWNIPDGFYLVGDSDKPQPDFQKAMIEAVALVTHIAPPDENGEIIGAPIQQHGVINYAYSSLGLCAGLSQAKYATTTEVYPDSPKSDDENCILAQVAALTSGLEFVVNAENLSCV